MAEKQKMPGYVQIVRLDDTSSKPIELDLYPHRQTNNRRERVIVEENATYGFIVILPAGLSRVTIKTENINCINCKEKNQLSEEHKRQILKKLKGQIPEIPVGYKAHFCFPTLFKKKKLEDAMKLFKFRFTTGVEHLIIQCQKVSEQNGATHSKPDRISFYTKEFYCRYDEEYRGENINAMMHALLDGLTDRELSRWMFAGDAEEPTPNSVFHGKESDEGSLSMPITIGVINSIIKKLEKLYWPFKMEIQSTITKEDRTQPLRKVQRSGTAELLWVSKNTDVLFEAPQGKGFEYLGRRYLPSKIRTTIRTNSLNTYENRLILGFLEDLYSIAKTFEVKLDQDQERDKEECDFIQGVQGTKEGVDDEGGAAYQIALINIRKEYLNEIRTTIHELKKIKSQFESLLIGVKPELPHTPRKTKVFQEVTSYSEIYKHIIKWQSEKHYVQAREDLALDLLKSHALYEYYVLLRILMWLKKNEFKKDEDDREPIRQIEYSIESTSSENTTRVSNLFCLKKGDVKIRLYYQPVIHCSYERMPEKKPSRVKFKKTPESSLKILKIVCRKTHVSEIDERKSGITLRRISRKGAYYTPDFLLAVSKKGEAPRWHAFDAKHSKICDLLHPKYNKQASQYAEAMYKYIFDIGGERLGDRIASLWLFNGRELSCDSTKSQLRNHCDQCPIKKEEAEARDRSIWVSNPWVDKIHQSGICPLYPTDGLPSDKERCLKDYRRKHTCEDCLDDVLRPILGLEDRMQES